MESMVVEIGIVEILEMVRNKEEGWGLLGLVIWWVLFRFLVVCFVENFDSFCC